jgi:peptidoglycan/xylan/chitin deacetylase (PgdA/CDA1 family)
MNPISIAFKGKGLSNLSRRSTTLVRRYGLTPGVMARALEQFAAALRRFECSVTFPITAEVLRRNPRIIQKLQDQGIEFAIHGYRHVDHSLLSAEIQSVWLSLAGQAFAQTGIQARGFRCPYFRGNVGTWTALQQQGYWYDSSQTLAWDVLNGRETRAYQHALNFYGARPASQYPSLPSLEDGLVRIPCSLPDDEALVERLALETPTQMNALWMAILERTYKLGELFTVGLHPERIGACQSPLTAVLAQARSLTPAVWIARLDEIAAWWRERTNATVQITDVGDSQFRVTVAGPEGITVLARSAQVDAPTAPWAESYQQVKATTFTVRAPTRPFIGLSPTASPQLADWLRQQGYIVETSPEGDHYSYYLDQAEFAAEHKRPLLAQIEQAEHPLVRLSRWPNGARSTISITGDIDALTLWDYGLRFLGR